MTRMTARVWVLLALAGVMTPAVVTAQQTCDRTRTVANASESPAYIRELNGAGCLGGPSCDSPLCLKLKPLLEGSSPAKTKAAEALRALLVATGTAAKANPEVDTLLTQMGLSLARFREDGRSQAAAWTMEDLTLFSNEPYALDIEKRLNSCADASNCKTAVQQAQTLIELSTLFRRVLNKANESSRNAFAERLAALDSQWRAYLGSSRGQYPWELALNSALYRKSAGFDAPPTSQWVFAHPGAAFELSRSTSDRQPSESLLLELAGVYRWSWAEGKMRQRWGGSLALAWRDAGVGRQKLGYGVLIYLPRASTLGYVWRRQDDRDEHAVVLSADLVKFLSGTQGVRERLIGK